MDFAELKWDLKLTVDECCSLTSLGKCLCYSDKFGGSSLRSRWSPSDAVSPVKSSCLSSLIFTALNNPCPTAVYFHLSSSNSKLISPSSSVVPLAPAGSEILQLVAVNPASERPGCCRITRQRARAAALKKKKKKTTARL